MSLFSLAFASILAVALLRWWLKRISVKHVEGPPSASFWLGHELVLRSQDEFGDLETKWRSEYGTIYRIRGCFGQDLLVVSDPKAFEHIFHTSRPYPKTSDTNFIFGLILGGTEGLIVVEKDVHRRQRKILNPAFSPANLRDYQVVNAMKISTGTGEKIDVVDWMGKVSLDIIGLSKWYQRFLYASWSNIQQVLFRYDFGSLDGQDTELGEAMKHLLPEKTRQLASVGETARKIAREILAAQAKLGVQDELDKDIVDILTRARLTGQMSDDEIELQFMTFLIAGHETTSATPVLVAHSYHNDYDSLPFLNAAIKEVLRFHPMVHAPMRTAPYDDILPLSGSKTLTIPKGQTLLCSVYSYNRYVCPIPLRREVIANFSKSAVHLGDDAEKWNPSRFLEKSIPVSLGVYANLMTFSSGSRSCIGWRFAVMEMQTILANLIQNFEFSLPEGTVIQQFPGSQAIVPVVKGEAHLGSRVPLRIRSLE
ncbi:cytochrome P450 [Desarmillaria tabescens]|uniref:Cytochrome P450 n=1 Tax=Armillaria tabescens TaxID=1929756 RepID=A0AA39JJI0_ARMTA|nr:cytochrome P450 [Desarmillaria tabescens]KAK0443055.1 cytochrome P450 [Desarmillaria tabescens]